MKKYKKPVLDIVEFDNMDVMFTSDLMTPDSAENGDATHIADELIKVTDSYSTVDPTPEAHETSESAETIQDSGESTDGPAPQGEDPTEPGLDADTVEPTDETDTQAEQQPDDGGLS